MTLVLHRPDLAALVDMAATIEAVELVHADIARGTAVQPAPASFELPGGVTRIIPMTAASARLGLSAVKVLADVPDNRGRGLPTQRSLIVLTDLETGECVAMLDGAVPTRERTAAASAVATRHLARPDSTVLGLVGAGALAVAHVVSHAQVLDLESVVVWSRSAETLAAFRAGVAKAGVDVRILAADSVRTVVDAADVVCTLTPSREPVLQGAWLRPGQHLNVVGAPPRADHREVDAAAIARSTVVVDSTATTLTKSGDALLAIAEGTAEESTFATELGAVIAGFATGRSSTGEITLFDSVGIGAQDLAVSSMYLDRARLAGLGTALDLAAPSLEPATRP